MVLIAEISKPVKSSNSLRGSAFYAKTRQHPVFPGPFHVFVLGYFPISRTSSSITSLSPHQKIALLGSLSTTSASKYRERMFLRGPAFVRSSMALDKVFKPSSSMGLLLHPTSRVCVTRSVTQLNVALLFRKRRSRLLVIDPYNDFISEEKGLGALADCCRIKLLLGLALRHDTKANPPLLTNATLSVSHLF